MNDYRYIERISFLLNAFIGTVKTMGTLNLHDLNIHAEDFFRDFYNSLFGYHLQNANAQRANEPGIDLVDTTSKIVVQVSSTATKSKINESFRKADATKYRGFRFTFIFLTNDASTLRSKQYEVPAEYSFTPETDIHDVITMVAAVKDTDIDTKKAICDLVEKHFGKLVKAKKNPSALAEVVKIISEKVSSSDIDLNNRSFRIEEKISYNHLDSINQSIVDSGIYIGMLDRIYESAETLGRNTRRVIHSTLQRVYEDNKDKYTPQELYRYITDEVKSIVENSENCPADLYVEEIYWAVSVIVADAFEACKIFENPQKQS